MAAAVLLMNGAIVLPGHVRLIVDVALGSGVFAAASLALWTASGRPPGPEADGIANLRRYLGR
jgi:hypothetical protein